MPPKKGKKGQTKKGNQGKTAAAGKTTIDKDLADLPDNQEAYLQADGR